MSIEAASRATPTTGGIWEDPAVVALVEGAPCDVRVMKLQDVCTRITDGTHKTPGYQPSGIRFISIKNIRPFLPVNWETYEKYISEEEHRALTKRCKPEFDDILFPRIGTLGFAKRIDFNDEVSIFVGLGLLKPNKSAVRPKYLEYWMNHPLIARLSRDRATGSGRLTLPLEQSREFPVPVPPLAKQDEIVAELDKQFSRLNEAVTNLKRVEANLKRYEEATIREATVAAKRDSPIHTASELFNWSSGVNLPASKQHGGSVPVYGGNGITGYHSQGNISEATVVIGRVGAGCGNVHLVEKPAWITDNAIYASRVVDTILLPYAALVFRAANLNSRAAGSGQPFVNKRMLYEVQMPLPSLEEQHRIVAEVDRRLSIVREVVIEVDTNLTRARALRQAVLARAFNVGGEHA